MMLLGFVPCGHIPFATPFLLTLKGGFWFIVVSVLPMGHASRQCDVDDQEPKARRAHKSFPRKAIVRTVVSPKRTILLSDVGILCGYRAILTNQVSPLRSMNAVRSEFLKSSHDL